MKHIFREAFLTVTAQKLASFVTLVLVAGMCIAVLLTSGKAQGNQQAVLSTIDSAGTRSIIISAGPDAGLDSSVISRLTAIEGVESVIALGSVQDVRNSRLPDGTPVPLRDYWGSGLAAVNPNEALASKTGLEALGMQSAIGSVSNPQGIDVAVVGLIADPSSLASYEPLLLTPRHSGDVGNVSSIVVVAVDAAIVGAVTEVIRPIVASLEPGQVSIETSRALALLHGTINEQLGTFGVALTIGTLLMAGALVAVVQTALVLLKRKDWGRRRALGASRQMIVFLILAQTTIISILGAGVGVLTALITLSAQMDPLPSLSFVAAVAILAIAVSVVAALLPAVIASRRDPIKELRVA